MKISPKQYARSLAEAAEGVSEKEEKILTERFLGILEKNSDLKKMPKIISEMEKINEAQSGVKKAKLATAVELSDVMKKEVAQKLENVFKERIVLSAKIVPEILGGIIIEAGNEILDASARATISKFKQALSI